jgi:hypothetical protein
MSGASIARKLRRCRPHHRHRWQPAEDDRTYTYDDLDHLLSAANTNTPALSQTFTYDLGGAAIQAQLSWPSPLKSRHLRDLPSAWLEDLELVGGQLRISHAGQLGLPGATVLCPTASGSCGFRSLKSLVAEVRYRQSPRLQIPLKFEV